MPMNTAIVLPVEADYPRECFQSNLPPELRVGCAWVYFKSNPIARQLFIRRIQDAFAMLPPRPYEAALDVGTGAGFLLPTLSALAGKVEAVDLSPVLRYAQEMTEKRRLQNVRVQQADLLQLPFATGEFDLLVCMSVIEHIPDPVKAFDEMGRVLRPGGILLLGYPLEHALLRLLENLLRAEKRVRHFFQGHPQPRGKSFHPHVSHYSRIEASWNATFQEEKRRNVTLLGVPLYRVLCLKRTG
jgi:SAM-dependent methyltransferase